MALSRYFWRAPWISARIAQRNYKRAVLVDPFKESEVKRNFKKMDGRMRILKHI